MSRCDPDPRYATYTGEVRAQAVRDLLHEAQQYEREGLPLSAAVYRECAAELAAAASATSEGLRRIGVAVAVWAGMAAVQQRAVSVVASEPEYPDAESYSSNARADLIAAGFEHPDEVFVMLVQIARGAVSDTKRCILDRLPIAGPRGVLP